MLAQTDRDTRVETARAPGRCEVTIVAHDVGSIGGMERALAELVLGLRDLGHEVTVIARTCELPAEAGVRFHRVRGPRRPLLLAHPWFMLAGSLAVAKRRRGIVQTTGAIVLNRVDAISVHYCHRVGPASPSRSTIPFRVHARLVRRLLRTAERVCFHLNRTATFICVSEGVADEIREHYRDLSHVVTIQNGVDVDAFAPGLRSEEAREVRATLGIAEDRLVALFVGGEWARKGLQSAIRALASAPEWVLGVAGGGDSEHYQELADSLGVGRSVYWLGVSRDVAPLYELADALVFPSSYEAFSLVTLEAAASGLPILATPINGVRELVRDGQEGFMISQQPDLIAERMRRLAHDPALKAEMGRAARRVALKFSWKEMVRRHHELYMHLVAENQVRAND